MAAIHKFEDLEIWQKARILNKRIYDLSFTDPLKSDFRLKDQIRGSTGSIMDNIAEGFERNSRLEFINSLGIAKGEVGELKSQLYRMLDIKYVDEKLFKELFTLVEELNKQIASFIIYLNQTSIKGYKFKNRI